MVKHKVNPIQPFKTGLAPPDNSVALISRVEAIQHTPRHKKLLEAPYIEPEERIEINKEGLKRIAGEIKSLGNIINTE